MIVNVGDFPIAVEDTDVTCVPSSLTPWVDFNCPMPRARCRTVVASRLPAPETVLLDSGLTWRVEALTDGVRICLMMGDARHGRTPYCCLDLDPVLETGIVYCEFRASDVFRLFGLQDPLHELWTNFWLLRGNGVLVHCLGVLIDGQAYLFAGKSGAGKSTLARVFDGKGVGTIISDDRVILRVTPAGIVAHGTPWHGEAPFAAPVSAPLGGIFFLRQSTDCRVTPASLVQAAGHLFSSCFLAGWPRRSGLDWVAYACEKIASSVSCSYLEFTPDSRVLSVLKWHTR